MTDNQTQKTRDGEPFDLFYGTAQPGRFRFSTQAGPGTMSATILYDTLDGNRTLVVFNHRVDAARCAAEMNARTFKYDTDINSYAHHAKVYADGHPRCEETVEPINLGDEVGVRVTFTDGAVAVYATGCEACAAERGRRENFFPSHVASQSCESGRRAHCTCDRCF